MHKSIVIIFVCVLYCNGELYLNDNGTVKITVFTDADNQNVHNFFQHQLVPTYRAFEEFIEIEFVPWGNTNRVGGDLDCVGGALACFVNRIHRCGLFLSRDQTTKMQFMACEFNRTSQNIGFQGSYACARSVGINLINLDNCVFSLTLDDIDFNAERATQAFLQRINYIPGIMFDDNVDENLHRNGLERLYSMICFALAATPDSGVDACKI